MFCNSLFERVSHGFYVNDCQQRREKWTQFNCFQPDFQTWKLKDGHLHSPVLNQLIMISKKKKAGEKEELNTEKKKRDGGW